MKRHIAHITIQADTPLKVGSNDSDFIQDAPIQKDWNNLPMILGTSITGVLRKEFSQSEADNIFGKDMGSSVIISNALLLGKNKKVSEQLLLEKSQFLKIFDNLPIREHTAITENGVAKEHSKFDEEVVYKGTRFKFSIEVLEDKIIFDKLIEKIQLNTLRIGAGSTKGFGKFKVISIKTQTFTKEDYNTYSSSLNHKLENLQELNIISDKNYVKYILNIMPDDFFMFGSGFGDSDADMTPVYEQVIDYRTGELSENMILIPASSIKGAISHRVAFYYNKYLLENENEKDYKKVGEKNAAVKVIFGHKKEEDKNTKKELGQKGRILISDCFKENTNQTKIFDHVSIDRFTGGATEGALFQEKTISKQEDNDYYTLEILLEKDDENIQYQKAIRALENSLKDICNGMLSLGGATTKGHGIFSGTCTRDGEAL